LAIEVAKHIGSVALVYRGLADKYLASNEMAIPIDLFVLAHNNYGFKLNSSSNNKNFKKS
jgi:hypothetical protein|tara:strand:- start:332 stop:511 length:180 start_codon:yes stop_codon:yes gene_type:complete